LTGCWWYPALAGVESPGGAADADAGLLRSFNDEVIAAAKPKNSQ